MAADVKAKMFDIFHVTKQRALLPPGYEYDMQYAAKVYLLRALDEADAVNMRRAIFKHKEVTVKRRRTSKESDKGSEPESLPVIPLDTESNWWDNDAQLDAE